MIDLERILLQLGGKLSLWASKLDSPGYPLKAKVLDTLSGYCRKLAKKL